MSFCLKLSLVFFLFIFVFTTQVLAASSNPDWAKEFYGQVRFQLSDDPEFARASSQVETLKTELTKIRATLTLKQSLLKQKTDLQVSKSNEIKEVQKTLASNNQLIQNSQKELELQKTTIGSMDNAIAANEELIRNKNGELLTLNNQLSPLKEKLIQARADVEGKKQNLEAAINKCRETQGAAFDCLNEDAQVALANQKLAQAKDTEKYLSEQVTRLSLMVSDIEKAILEANKIIASSQETKRMAINKITELNNLVTKLNNEFPLLNERLSRLNTEIASLQSEMNSLNSEVATLANVEKQQAQGVERANAELNKFRQELIAQIIDVNRRAFNLAVRDGSQEGIEISSLVANDFAKRNAIPAGLRDGERAGRERDYRSGAAIGEQEGTRVGIDEGTSAGKIQGQNEGYRLAGVSAGRIAGADRANVSDATSVGRNEGRQAGLLRATNDGRVEGVKLAEKETLIQLESQKLNEVMVNGQYAGAFDYADGLPYFSGTKHKYYNENFNNARMILRLAYSEGYRLGYDSSAERTYYDNVQRLYKEAYNFEYDAAYKSAFTRDYSDSFEQGRNEQFKIAYDRNYRPAFESAFNTAKAYALQNPDRSSGVYKTAFQNAELSAYNSRYAELRQQAYASAERESYNQNITSQTEAFKAKRSQELVALYAQYPVLKFSSNSLLDAGINGVAGHDGLFQPGEKILQDLVIINFSSVSASGVKVLTGNGAMVQLPTLPAKSRITVKGAALDQIPFQTAVGGRYQTSLSMQMELNSQEKAIQGRYFENISKGVLASTMNSVTTAYPMALSLSLEQNLVLGKKTKLKLDISNKSNRSFSGAMSFELRSSLGGRIIAKSFSGINSVESVAQKADAEILVEDENDIFSDVDFSVVMKQGDVVLGEVKNAAKDYVRAGYIVRENAPIIFMKSTTLASRQNYKDLVAELGGAEAVSIFDVSSGENLGDMKGKTIFVINDQSDSLISSLEKLFISKGAFVVFIADRGLGGSLDKAMQNLNALKSATKLPFALKGLSFNLVSTSPLLNSGLDSKVSAIEIETQNVEAALSLASLFKLSDDELLSEITTKITAENFFGLEEKAKLLGKMSIIRALEDVLSLSRSDKSALKRFKEDSGLFMNKFKASVENGSSEGRLATSLLSFAFYGGCMKGFDQISVLSDLSRKVKSSFEKSADDMINTGFLGIGKGTARKFLKKSGHKDYIDRAQDVKEEFYPL